MAYNVFFSQKNNRADIQPSVNNFLVKKFFENKYNYSNDNSE